MDYLENLGRKSNIKHYIANLLLLACVGIIYVEASVGVMLLIAVACINIVMYMKEKIEEYLIELGFVKNHAGEFNKGNIWVAPVDQNLDLLI